MIGSESDDLVSREPQSRDAKLLRDALVANAMFSAVTGSLLLMAGGGVAEFLGVEASWIVRLIGAALLPFAAAVAIASQPQNLAATSAFSISAADFAWVVASVVLLALWPDLLSPAGRVALAVVAAIVAAFGVAQVAGARRLPDSD